MKRTAAQAVETAKNMIGMPYWYASSGQAATEQWLNSLINGQFKAKWTPPRIAKARGEAGKFPHCFDCIGLIRYVSGMQNNRDALFTNADGLRMKSNPQPINTLPEVPGVCVFMRGHVGLYIGGGRVIEAYNFKHVDNNPLSFQRWTHWGFCPWIDYGEARQNAGTPASPLKTGDSVAVKRGTTEYYPGQSMPAWVQGQQFKIAQVTYNGKAVMKGGKQCVLLDHLNTWCAVENLEKAQE